MTRHVGLMVIVLRVRCSFCISSFVMVFSCLGWLRVMWVMLVRGLLTIIGFMLVFCLMIGVGLNLVVMFDALAAVLFDYECFIFRDRMFMRVVVRERVVRVVGFLVGVGFGCCTERDGLFGWVCG